MKSKIILLLLTVCSGLVLAQPEVVFDKKLIKELKVQPCTEVQLPLEEEIDVKEAIECDYPKMEVIKIQRNRSDRDIAHVKLYAKGKIKNIIVHYPTGLTIIAEEN
ncbi:MAG: hypothetical protein HRU38_25340 [Saccharospirillaceae bacterium]|nr:hypothetical protein [Pseudomonadales bacterium]NRB81942.1 hypothetical protein [Saccharospirillaceae bacterium]